MRKYRKPHRYKRKKPIFHQRFFWLGILALVFVGAVFYLLFLSDFSQVKKIIVTGEEKASAKDIELLVERRLAGNKVLFFPTRSIFVVNLGQIRKDIRQNFPQIAEVEITRGIPDTINVLVLERLAVALWCERENCFLVDKEGVIFEKVETKPLLVSIRTKSGLGELGEKVIEKEVLGQIFSLISKLQENLKISIVEASVISPERLNLKTSEGWEIYFTLKGDLDWQLTELSLVLEKQIPPEKRKNLEYIDLRFSRVYYK